MLLKLLFRQIIKLIILIFNVIFNGMPKKMKIKQPPKFLTQKLDDKTFQFVKANVSKYLEQLRKANKGKACTALEILPDFFAWLGDRAPKFRHLVKAQLKTVHEGTYQVYNLLRKRLESIEEKQVDLTAPITVKAETPKSRTPNKVEKPKEEEADAVSITADGNYHGHHEEKDTRFRKQMASDQDESEPEAGEKGFEEDEEKDPLASKPKFERLRDMLVDILANFEEDELTHLNLDCDLARGTSLVNF